MIPPTIPPPAPMATNARRPSPAPPVAITKAEITTAATTTTIAVNIAVISMDLVHPKSMVLKVAVSATVIYVSPPPSFVLLFRVPCTGAGIAPEEHIQKSFSVMIFPILLSQNPFSFIII
ncbi:hypothetical protein D3C73_1270940 [compost metagenome]